MRTIGAIFGITALAAVVFSPLPAAAFGIHLGPLHFGVGHHHHHHHLHMRTNPNEARTRPNDVSRGSSYSTAARGDNAAKTDQTDRETRAETNSEALESCAGLAQGVTNLPIDQIRQTVHPTADQEAALEDLSATSLVASDIIKSCPASAPLTPVGRLDAAEQRLDAAMQAIHILRSPLERFYRSLSDEQVRQFNAIIGSTEGARSTGNMATLCSQQAGAVIDLQRIEQVVQPTAQQQNTFDELKKAAQKVGDQLQSSCPTAVPKWPVARLDTMATRLSNMVDAIEAVRPYLKNFYASLSDEQKERFNLMGSPPKSASSPTER
jgi:ABC-type transporter MlaC component